LKPAEEKLTYRSDLKDPTEDGESRPAEQKTALIQGQLKKHLSKYAPALHGQLRAANHILKEGSATFS
jgi:hypothetical protein